MPAPQTKWEQAATRAMRSCTAVFGEGKDDAGAGRITYAHANGPTYQTDGIFEAATETVDLDTGVAGFSHTPKVSFALADLQALPEQGDHCTIRGQLYRVVEPQFDGQGNVTLRLHEA